MEKSVRAGRGINEDEIPPPVLVKGVGGGGGGGGSGGNTTPAAMSPAEDGTSPPVPKHATTLPASIPHDVAFEDGERSAPQPQPRVSPVKQVGHGLSTVTSHSQENYSERLPSSYQ